MTREIKKYEPGEVFDKSIWIQIMMKEKDGKMTEINSKGKKKNVDKYF